MLKLADESAIICDLKLRVSLVIQATDKDITANFSTVYYEIIAVDPPFLVDRETGAVTTADVFTGRSGDVDKLTVIAYDNKGEDPSLTSTAILTVKLVYFQCSC